MWYDEASGAGSLVRDNYRDQGWDEYGSFGKKGNAKVTRRVSEAEQCEKPYIDTGPRLRFGLLCVDADDAFFAERTIPSVLHF